MWPINIEETVARQMLFILYLKYFLKIKQINITIYSKVRGKLKQIRKTKE